MTLSAHPGPHATGPTGPSAVPPRVPLSGAPPGPPTTVWIAVALLWVEGVFAALAVGFFALLAVAFGLGTGEYPGLAVCLVLAAAGCTLVGGWFVLAHRVRGGHRAARLAVTAFSGLGLAAAVASATTMRPDLTTLGFAALQVAVPVLLFLPASRAWFRPGRAVSPAPGPGSPPR